MNDSSISESDFLDRLEASMTPSTGGRLNTKQNLTYTSTPTKERTLLRSSKRTVSSMKKEQDGFDNKIRALEKRLKRLQTVVSTKDNEVDELLRHISSGSNSQESLENQNVGEFDEVELARFREEYLQVKDELKQQIRLRRSHEEALEKLEVQNAELNDENQRNKKQLDTLKDENDRIKQELQELRRMKFRQEMSQDGVVVQTAYAGESTRDISVGDEVDFSLDAQEKGASLNDSERSDGSQPIPSYKTIETLDEKVSQLTKDVENIRALCKEREFDLQTANAELSQYKGQCSFLDDRVSRLQERNWELRTNRKDLESKLSSVYNLCDNLETNRLSRASTRSRTVTSIIKNHISTGEIETGYGTDTESEVSNASSMLSPHAFRNPQMFENALKKAKLAEISGKLDLQLKKLHETCDNDITPMLTDRSQFMTEESMPISLHDEIMTSTGDLNSLYRKDSIGSSTVATVRLNQTQTSQQQENQYFTPEELRNRVLYEAKIESLMGVCLKEMREIKDLVDKPRNEESKKFEESRPLDKFGTPIRSVPVEDTRKKEIDDDDGDRDSVFSGRISTQFDFDTLSEDFNRALDYQNEPENKTVEDILEDIKRKSESQANAKRVASSANFGNLAIVDDEDEEEEETHNSQHENVFGFFGTVASFFDYMLNSKE
mmetsp:Transcript_19379/g.21984  ORF Transcript_19379/g.21984 Transcript_19379/m.21984 type:complete len:665 (+) Transcript_19379:340-2334(+)